MRNIKKKVLHPVYPGKVLVAEFLKPLDLSQNKLAVNIGVPARRINEIVLEKRKVSADTALRLGRFFGMSSEFWLGLQSQYDLDIAADALGIVSRRRSRNILRSPDRFMCLSL